eukprot:NODE_468_length_8097_cov_0.251813.p1 type:complete len:418 gc:universal NODE_468_length_8097_cov_0.251813:6690-7943(+)
MNKLTNYSKTIFPNKGMLDQFELYLTDKSFHLSLLEFANSFEPASKTDLRKLVILIALFLNSQYGIIVSGISNIDEMVADGFIWFLDKLKTAQTSSEILKYLVYSVIIHTKGFGSSEIENIQSSFEIASALLDEDDLLGFCRSSKQDKFKNYKKLFYKINEVRAKSSFSPAKISGMNDSPDVLFRSCPKKHNSSIAFEWSIENCRTVLSIMFSRLDAEIISKSFNSTSAFVTHLNLDFNLKMSKFVSDSFEIYKTLIKICNCSYLYLIPQFNNSFLYGLCPSSLTNVLCFGSYEVCGMYYCSECDYDHKNIPSSPVEVPDVLLKLLFNYAAPSTVQHKYTNSELLLNFNLEPNYSIYAKNSLLGYSKNTISSQTIQKFAFKDGSDQTYEKVQNGVNTSKSKQSMMFFKADYFTSRRI